MIPGVWSVLHGDFSQRGTCSQVTPTNVWDYVGTTKSDLPDLKVFVNKERYCDEVHVCVRALSTLRDFKEMFFLNF